MVVDLDNDGNAEVVVATWTDYSATSSGYLYVISSTGSLITSMQLPYGTSGEGDGALGAPTLANIDSGMSERECSDCVDSNLEVVLMTEGSGLVAYEFSNSANAKILWQTGRGNWARSGNVVPPPTDGSTGGSSSNAPALLVSVFNIVSLLIFTCM